jgi:hypothetical protein
MELLLEVLCQYDVSAEEFVPIPMREMKWARVAVANFCEMTRTNLPIDPRRVIVDEEGRPGELRLYADLPLPNGEVVTITGQIDLLEADPPDGFIIIDYKGGFRKPPKDPDPDPDGERSGLTELGWVQQKVYDYLVYQNFPTAQHITFREVHLLWREARSARTERWQTERVLDPLTAQVAALHKAVTEGPNSKRWVPSAGPHCALCANPRACPIRDVEGIPATAAEAQRLAQEVLVAKAVVNERRPLLYGWVDAYGPIEIPHSDGRRVMGWDMTPDGKRNFRVFEPSDVPESEFDEKLIEEARKAGVLAE